MSGVPYIFANATTSIPLSELDVNFATVATLGNASVGLGNTTSVVGNLTLQNVTITSGTSNITPNVASVTGILPQANGGTGTTTGYYGFKNRIINGAMVIDQRNAGASITANNGTFCVDRFKMSATQSGFGTFQQNAGSVTPPTGFANYLGFTSTAATSVNSFDLIAILQRIEGYNIADLAWGTANAKTVTLSFWVRSSLTGTFGGGLGDSGGDYTYPFSYSIPVANTWTQISLTITGPTSGTWLTTNGTGINLSFSLGTGSTFSGTAGAWTSSVNAYNSTGSVNVVATNGATFYITGVQLEVGSTATSFDYRPFGTEVVLCQRYFQKSYDIETAVGTATRNGYINWNWQNLSNYGVVTLVLPVRMRAAPTSTNYNPDLTNTVGGRYYNGTSEVAFTGSMAGWTNYQSNIQFNKDSTSSTNMLIQWTASAEL